ncbi:MAG TPA: alpha/beta hydrolase [Actinocrinis sp.]|nr:alpha/beta hydrolase [Actinocrinis sp.]
MSTGTLSNDLVELKEFARLHAKGQGMKARRLERILARIHSDEPGAPDSWARVWSAEAQAAAARGKSVQACQYYALARFPHHGDDDRIRAQRGVVESFDAWRGSRGRGIEKLEFATAEGTFSAWAAGLDAPKPLPLLVIMGGIVSVKEQWAQLLPRFVKLGFATVVAEMPGVGENTLPYGPDSWRLLGFLLDQLKGRAQERNVSLLTLSFSGHMALRAAGHDARIGRILTVGAPITRFFTDENWWPRVPRITKDTLVALTDTASEAALVEAFQHGWALTPEELRDVRVPVRYVVSARDEIIPGGERAFLAEHLADVGFIEFDDVHGSPAHLGDMRLWLLLQLLRTNGIEDRRTKVLATILGLRAARSRRAAARSAPVSPATA